MVYSLRYVTTTYNIPINQSIVHPFIIKQQRQLVYRVIQEVQQYQQRKYAFEPREPLKTFLTALPALPDKQLYDISLDHEPREKKK
jgi:hypothetical protein